MMSIESYIETSALTDVYTGAVDSLDFCPADPKTRRCTACESLGAATVHRTLNENGTPVGRESEQAISDTNALVDASFPTSMLAEDADGFSCGDRRVRVVEAAVELASRIVIDNIQNITF